jgi:hypothetical protein
MHTQETQQKFIERRAQGWTYVRIVTELGVAKSTLIEWSRKYRFDIANLHAIEIEALRNRILGSTESRVVALSERLSRIEEEIRKRNLADVSTARLYLLAETFRREIERLTDGPKFASPVKNIPSDEYVENIQEWTP